LVVKLACPIDTLGHENGRFLLEHSVVITLLLSLCCYHSVVIKDRLRLRGLLRGIFERGIFEAGCPRSCGFRDLGFHGRVRLGFLFDSALSRAPHPFRALCEKAPGHPNVVILSAAWTSRSEVHAKSKDPYTLHCGRNASGNSPRALDFAEGHPHNS